MKNVRLAIALSVSFTGVAGLLFACTSDDSIITNVEPDGGPDTSVPDASKDNNITEPTDTGTDAPVFPDAGLTLENYQGKLAEVLCRSLARCCYGDATLDAGAPVDGGGTYDQTACLSFYKAVGFGGNSGEFPATNTNLTLNNSTGDECIGKLDTLECNTPGVMYTAVAKACYAAIVGKLAVGSPCEKTLECAPGNFCNVNDGGVGACTALRGEGGNCGDWFAANDPETNAGFGDEACSYRGRGVDTGLYCDFYDFVGGDYRAQSDWKCKQAGGIGAQCASNPWCKDSLCDDLDTVKCITPKQFFAPTPAGSTAGCGKFVTP